MIIRIWDFKDTNAVIYSSSIIITPSLYSIQVLGPVRLLCWTVNQLKKIFSQHITQQIFCSGSQVGQSLALLGLQEGKNCTTTNNSHFFLALSTDLAKPPAHCRPVSPACFLAAQPLLPSLFPRIELLGQAGHRGGGRSPLIGFSATDFFYQTVFFTVWLFSLLMLLRACKNREIQLNVSFYY